MDEARFNDLYERRFHRAVWTADGDKLFVCGCQECGPMECAYMPDDGWVTAPDEGFPPDRAPPPAPVQGRLAL